MYQILMPIDTDVDRALAQAEYIANLPGSDEVRTMILFVFSGRTGEDLPNELKPFKSATRVESVRRAQEYLEEHGVEVEILDESGDAAEDIIDEANRYEVDSIVLGGRKRSPAGKVIFGSVTQSVILNTDRPVVVTGAKHN